MNTKAFVVSLVGLVVAHSGVASAVHDCAACDVSAAQFARLAGETDDSGRLQRAIEAASPHGVAYVPKGVYEIGSTLWVTNRASLMMHKSAILRAVRPMDYVMIVDLGPQWGVKPGDRADGKLPAVDQEDYNFFIRGGQIDGNAMASCMALDNFHHFTLANVTFLNGMRYGLRIDGRGGHGYELVASDCYFKTVIRGCKGNEAVFASGGDSHFIDCIVVDYTVGFHLGPRSWANKLTRCHVWGGPIREMLDDSVNYLIEENGNVLTDCYADTGKTGFWLKAGGTRLFGCSYFSNPVFKLKDVVMVRCDGGQSLFSGCTFSKTDPTAKLLERHGGEIVWRDCSYSGFGPDEELPGDAFGKRK